VCGTDFFASHAIDFFEVFLLAEPTKIVCYEMKTFATRAPNKHNTLLISNLEWRKIHNQTSHRENCNEGLGTRNAAITNLAESFRSSGFALFACEEQCQLWSWTSDANPF
jgi:hypothetical protein